MVQESKVALSLNVCQIVSKLLLPLMYCAELAASDRYQVSILTRNVSDPRACALAATYKNVHLIEGSYTSESGLRAAFKDQDACYFNIDSFGIGEPLEYFWTFRAYE